MPHCLIEYTINLITVLNYCFWKLYLKLIYSQLCVCFTTTTLEASIIDVEDILELAIYLAGLGKYKL